MVALPAGYTKIGSQLARMSLVVPHEATSHVPAVPPEGVIVMGILYPSTIETECQRSGRTIISLVSSRLGRTYHRKSHTSQT